ncbi:hypothetical protein K523DRAFT_237678 [Schizophyllum commune Tattone D]|nr:hypothetical protein K523DRAFT_237678 [Schizophyllum commune Tattone D]
MSSETPPTALLPTDILINVLHYLTPWDIFTIRRACRHFRDATMHRVVWIHALQRVIDDNNVFPPSFPLEKMSLSELTHAVFAPRKFFDLVRRVDTLPDQKVAPTAQFIATLWDNEEDGNHSYERVHLLPGGRFVVAAMQKVLRIFDIGYGPRPTVRTRPIFTLRWTQLENIAQGVENTWCEVSHLEWEANGESSDLLLFVTVTPYPRTTRPASIVVYKISDIASGPRGQQVAHLTLYPEMSSVHIKSVDGTRPAFTASESLVGVWDYAENSISLWRTESLQHTPVNAGLNIEETPTLVPMNVIFQVGSTVASYRRGKDWFFDVQAEQGLVTRYVFPNSTPNATGAGTPLIRVSQFRAHEVYPTEIIDILRLPNLHVGDEGVYTGIHCPGISESDPPGDMARVGKSTNEVLIRILRFSHPLDILRLRTVCKYLRDLTLQRIVWINALRAAVDRNDVFPPTFPLSDMSDTEIEHAIFGPIEFYKMVKQQGVRILGDHETTPDTPTVPKLQPIARRVFPIDIGEASLVLHPPDVVLLPGGRYVVIKTDRAIHIVDLGYHPDFVISTRPVFTLRKSDLENITTNDDTTWRVEHWSASGRTGDLLLYISVQQPSASARHGAIVIYKVTDLAGAPAGRQIAQLMMPDHSPFRICNIEGNRVCFASETGVVGVWNFASRCAARWQSCSASLSDLFVLSEDTVILCIPSFGTVGYELPPLELVSTGITSLADVYPAFTMTIPLPRSLRPTGSYGAYSGNGQELLYDYRASLVRRFVVPSRSSPMPCEVTRFKAIPDYDAEWLEWSYLPRLHVCEDGVFTGSHCTGLFDDDPEQPGRDAGINLHMSDRRYGKDAQGIDGAVTLLDYKDDEFRFEWMPQSIEFCPVSGRLCAADSVDGGLNLSVFDYIAPCARDLLGGGWHRFSKLPDDVWMNIMRYLKPLDIVALRQTSRRMKGPSLNRAVWMHALRVVVADNNVHPLTFPIEKMSTAELENAASCPQKLTRILLRAGQSFLAPVPQPEPVHRRAFYIKQEGDKPAVRSIRLLPGGRFLVVERLESVLIMDLGWRTEAVIRRSPIYILRKKAIGAGPGPTRACKLEHLVWDQGNGNLRLFFVFNGVGSV